VATKLPTVIAGRLARHTLPPPGRLPRLGSLLGSA